MLEITHTDDFRPPDIEAMMDAVDLDGSGEMEFDEFQLLLSGKGSS